MGEPGDFDSASPLVRELALEKSVVSDPGYKQLLRRQIVEARYAPVIQALYGEGGRVSLSLPIRYLEGEGRLEATLEVQEV